MSLTIKDMKAYVPARDFGLSKRFYTAIGFAPEPVDDSLVLHVVDPSGVLLTFVQ